MAFPDVSPGRSRLLPRFAMAAAVLVVGLVSYARTFEVPWYFDDVYAIVENPHVQDLSTAWSSFFVEPRGLTWLSFAFDFARAGSEVAAFHATNLAIHLAAGLAALLLLRRLSRGREDLALLGALIFVAHPIQTQAVTYVVQRGACLAGLLALAAATAYLRFRVATERGTSWRRAGVWAPYGTSLLAAALAMFAKENAAVVPLLLLLLEVVPGESSDARPLRRRLPRLAPFLIVPALLAFGVFGQPGQTGVEETTTRSVRGLSSFEPEALGGAEVTSLAYFATELEVVWRYLRRVALPVGQVFDYGLPVDPNPLRWTAFAGGAGVILLLALAWSLRRRAPPIALGIGWFFVALSVESTFIPLDAYFEHRLYLPMFGVALIVPAGLDRLFGGKRRRVAAAGAVLVALLVGLTLHRNEQWRDPVKLWGADLERGSQSYRSAIGLADALYARGETAAAEEVYRTFIERAESRCRATPCGARYLLNAGVALERLAEQARAADFYRRASSVDPQYARAHYNLGVVLYRSGDRRQALAEFRRASELSPGDASALFNWASVALELGDRSAADQVIPKLRRISPDHARRLEAQLGESASRGSL